MSCHVMSCLVVVVLDQSLRVGLKDQRCNPKNLRWKCAPEGAPKSTSRLLETFLRSGQIIPNRIALLWLSQFKQNCWFSSSHDFLDDEVALTTLQFDLENAWKCKRLITRMCSNMVQQHLNSRQSGVAFWTLLWVRCQSHCPGWTFPWNRVKGFKQCSPNLAEVWSGFCQFQIAWHCWSGAQMELEQSVIESYRINAGTGIALCRSASLHRMTKNAFTKHPVRHLASLRMSQDLVMSIYFKRIWKPLGNLLNKPYHK